MVLRKLARAFKHAEMGLVLALIMPVLTALRIRLRHRFLLKAYRRWGMRMKEWPNYLSARGDVDGTDLSQIYLGEGVTISSYVRLLTHDWSPHTVAKQLGVHTARPLGRFGPIHIDDFSFVGTGTIVMPGTHIGKGCIIGAGTVVRGTIPDYSLVIGSPGQIVGDTRTLLAKWADREAWDLSDEQRSLLSSGANERR